MKPLFAALFIFLLASTSHAGFISQPGGTSGAVVTETDPVATLGTVTGRGRTDYGANSFDNSVQFGSSASSHMRIGDDPTTGPFIKGVCSTGVECLNYYRQLVSGGKAGFKDSDGTIGFEYTEGTGVTKGGYTQLDICNSGNTTCHSWTDLAATFTEAQAGNYRMYFDLSTFRQYRITAFMSVAATTGDIEVQCDADSTFASEAILGQLTNPAANGNVGTWTDIPANECATAGGVWIRVGMINGNTTEDPAARRIGLELR